jgi:cytochrome c oxidase subunit 2
MKRGLAVLAILLLVVASAACGNDDNEDKTPTTGTGGAVTTATTATGGAATSATGGEATEATGGSATAGTGGGAATTGDAAKGKDLATSLGCTACHTVDGSKLVGPTWKGAYGEEVKLTNGDTVKVDDAYIHESIVDPGAKVVDGYQPIMPSFKGQVDDQQIADITAYIASLK